MRNNNLRKIMLGLFLAIIAGFSGCNSEDVEYDYAALEVNTNNMVFDASGNPLSTEGNVIKITTSRDWTISLVDKSVDWVAFSQESGTGDGEVTLTLLSNPDIKRSTTIRVDASIMRETITITQNADASMQELFAETFGTEDVSTRPKVGDFTGYDNGAPVVFSDQYGVADIRQTSNINPHVWLPAGRDASLKISSLDIEGAANMKLSFDVAANLSETTPSINTNVIKVSIDGTDFVVPSNELTVSNEYKTITINLTGVTGTPASEILFFAPSADNNAGMRIDNIRLNGKAGEVTTLKAVTAAASGVSESSATVGGSFILPSGISAPIEVGVEYKKDGEGDDAYVSKAADAVATPFSVELTGLDNGIKYIYRAYAKPAQGDIAYGAELSFSTLTVIDAIYFENVGTEVSKIGDSWPFIDQYSGWSKEGKLDQSGVTYTANEKAISVRNNGANYTPDAGVASDAPYFFIGGAGAYLQVNDINITGYDNFTFKVAISYQDDYDNDAKKPIFGAITNNSIKLEASLDGTSWRKLDYTVVGANPASWVQIEAGFRAIAGSDKLYIKLSEASKASSYRIDDLTLIAGGGDGGPELGGSAVPTVEADAGATISGTTATITGEYTMIDGTPHEVGVAYREEGSSDTYTQVKAATIASPFTVTISNLTPGKTYEYRGYLKESASSTAIEGAIISTFYIAMPGEIFFETFGADIEATTKVGAYTGYDNGAPIVFSDEYGNTDIRKTSSLNPNAWFPKDKDASLNIAGINTAGKTNLKLSLDVAANVKEVFDVQNIDIYFNDTKYNPSSLLIDALNQYSTIEVNLIGAVGTVNSTLKFEILSGNNAAGVRLDNIKLIEGQGGVTPTLAFGQATFTGSLKVGETIAGTEISIPYTNAEGTENYTIDVVVGGAGADGITVAQKVVTLTAGNGSVELPVSGEPTTEGAVTFTISGINELTDPNNVVSSTVAPAVATITPVKDVMAAFEDGEAVAAGTIIKGTVISNKAQANTAAGVLVLMDGTNAGDGISMIFKKVADNTFNVGDDITIDLTGTKYYLYNGLSQIEVPNNVTLDITVNSTDNTVTPVVVTDIDNLSNYLSMLVSINDAQAKVTSGQMSGNANLSFVSDGKEFIVFARNNNFDDESVPTGKGTITGIVSAFNNVQLIPRSPADYAGMTGKRDGTIEYGTPAFTATKMVAGEAVEDGLLKIGFDNNPEAGDADVTVTASIAGIDAVTNKIIAAPQGSGSLEIPITGTPAAAGDVTFTITIAGLAGNLTATGTVEAAGTIVGGKADFNTLPNGNASYLERTTDAGWIGTNAAIFQGGAANSSPTFTWIGDTNETKAMAINGKTTDVGTITSPTLTTGIGTLSFKYGHGFAETSGVSIKIAVRQGGTIIKSVDFIKANDDVAQNTAYEGSVELNIAGNFELVIINNSPSNSTSNKDRIALWDIEWTGYVN